MSDSAGDIPHTNEQDSYRAKSGQGTETSQNHELSLAEQVEQVPTEPGCYLWKDITGRVLYVGKAKNLRARMLQYIRREDDRAMIGRLMLEVAGFDYVVASTEHEALVLEINLIQRHHPPYNVALMDDKSYPYIALTKSDAYPAIKYTREKHKPGTRYFGPFTDARAAREAVELVRKITPLCAASCAEWRKCTRVLAAHEQNATKEDKAIDPQHILQKEGGRPCFDSHVGKGPGVCVGALSPEDYAVHVRQVEQFMAGKRSQFVAELTDEMTAAAAELDFEKAARVKRRLDVIESLFSSQRVVLSAALDVDVIGLWREETIAAACVFLVREGRVVRSGEFILDKGLDVGESELTSSFLKRYYSESTDIPIEIDVASTPDDTEHIEAWLSERRARAVSLHIPQRGQRVQLLEMAQSNARHALMRHSLRTGYEDKRSNQALLELENALGLDDAPMRIECFVISTIHGKHTVASMVVFNGGHPDKSQYRRFKIKTPLDEANDFLSMSEVLGRRYAPERMADGRFGARPDLLILDGGKPQLSAALEQLEALGLNIPVAGLAKSDEELFVPWDDTPVVLPSGSASLYLVKRLRDEAHRFAITFPRELRDKAMTVSILDEIDGVGPKRKRALRRAFGSMKRLREASLEDIEAVEGISADVAREVYETMRAWEAELSAGDNTSE
ncbi:MAG: excinuclease ABC subunit UvrC [Atopobiaceae bacterium]|nr:excinuclease ABC subunit UvrC [Atopobiaceae bacterium]